MDKLNTIENTLTTINGLHNVSNELKELAALSKPVDKKDIEEECRCLLQIGYILNVLKEMMGRYDGVLKSIKVIYDYKEDVFEVMANTAINDFKKLSLVFEEKRTSDNEIYLYKVFSNEDIEIANYLTFFLLENKKKMDRAFHIAGNFSTFEYGFLRNIIQIYSKNISNSPHYYEKDMSLLFNGAYEDIFEVVKKNLNVLLEKLFLEDDLKCVLSSDIKKNGLRI